MIKDFNYGARPAFDRYNLRPAKVQYKHCQANEATLTKTDLVDILADRLEIQRAQALQIVRQVFDEVQGALMEGRDVKLANFGTFTTRDKVARPGRNPRTGEVHEICARRVVSFVPAPHLRYTVSSYEPPVAVGNTSVTK